MQAEGFRHDRTLEKAVAQIRQLPEDKQNAAAEILLQTVAGWTQDAPLKQRQPGSAIGLITLTEAFDAPLEDFKAMSVRG